MIGIVLVTHGNLAREFLAALEHVVGPQQCVSTVCIGAEDDMEKRRSEILERARACDTGDGVIVLTDMFGGTPSNLAISIMEQARIEVLAGVNLPMLVKLASVRNRPIAEAVRMAQEAGRKYITVASRILGQEVSGLSVMGLMLLPAGIGSDIELSCSGRQAVEAMAALSALVESKFGED